MVEIMQDSSGFAARRHWCFAGFVAASAIVSWKTLASLAFYSLHEESSSHILLIPLISIYLLYTERARIAKFVRPGAIPFLFMIVAAAVILTLYFAERIFA